MRYFYRSDLFKILVPAILILLLSLQSYGKNSLDDLVFLSCKTDKNITPNLNNGYRAFILSDNAPFKTIFGEINSFLDNNENEIITLIIESESSEFLKELEQSNSKHYLAIPEQQSIYDLEDCKTKSKRLFVFTPEKTRFSYAYGNFICNYNVPPGFPNDIYGGFDERPENDLVIFSMDNFLKESEDTLNQHPEKIPQLFNANTGKLPNFFVTRHQEIFSAYHEAFLKQKWYTASVEYNGEPLEGITWKNMPQMTSFGKIHTTQGELSPYKVGFHFSPDVFNFNSQTSENIKKFYARQKDLEDEMILLLHFNQNIDNEIAKVSEIPFNNIEYKKDKSRGWCAVFNGSDNYIDYGTDIDLSDNFTLSVWVNPTNLNGNKSIIGKGKALSVKFRNGSLLFTTPGLKDHVMDSAVVQTNQWQQLTYVISAGNTVRFFRNGEIVGEQNAGEINSTEYSLLIGTNLWDEFFNGMMDDLTIWNRVLSDDEVKRYYQVTKEKNEKNIHQRSRNIGLLVVLLGFSVILLLNRRKNKKTQVEVAIKHQNPISSIKLKNKNKSSIELFGGFKIINRDGEDLTSRFSLRRKQFFILVLIETIKNNGVSSKQLTNYIWAGYSPERAKNNRSTQILRIREILAQNSGVNIEFNDKKWTLTLDDDIYCDLADYFNLMEQLKQFPTPSYNTELISAILKIVEKGMPLPNMDDEWLDNFKSEISEELLETFLPLYSNKQFAEESDLIIRLSHALLIYDPLNETILKHKVKSLVRLGKTSTAQECLDHFDKVYQQCYAQPFQKSITDIMEMD